MCHTARIISIMTVPLAPHSAAITGAVVAARASATAAAEHLRGHHSMEGRLHLISKSPQRCMVADRLLPLGAYIGSNCVVTSAVVMLY